MTYIFTDNDAENIWKKMKSSIYIISVGERVDALASGQLTRKQPNRKREQQDYAHP